MSTGISRRRMLAQLGLAGGAAALFPWLRSRAQSADGPQPKLLLFYTPHGTVFDQWRPSGGETDIRGLIRGVRLAFLAVAAFAAAGGWALASPLPLIVALVIAGIDVVETSFMLLVLGGPTPRDPTP